MVAADKNGLPCAYVLIEGATQGEWVYAQEHASSNLRPWDPTITCAFHRRPLTMDRRYTECGAAT